MSAVTGIQRRGPTTLSLADSAPDHDADGPEPVEATRAEAASTPNDAARDAEAGSAASADAAEPASPVVQPRRGASTMDLADSAPDEDAEKSDDHAVSEAAAGGEPRSEAASQAPDDAETPQLTRAATDGDGLPMRPVPGMPANGAAPRLDADGNPLPEDPEPETQPESDPVYASLMALMRAPMLARLQEASERGTQLAAQKKALLAERGQMDASAAARQHPEASGRSSGYNHPPGILAGIGMAAAGLGKGIGNAIGGAGKLLPTSAKRRSAALDNGIVELDREMAAIGGFRSSLVAKGYERTMAAAEGLYKARLKLSQQVTEFNDLFESHPKGKAFLRHIDVVAASRGVPASEIRRSIHDLTEGSPAIERLRQHSANLCDDPIFAEKVRAMEATVAKVRRDSETLTRGLSNAHDNGFDLSCMESLSEIMGKAQVQDSKLARPGAVVPLDTLNAELAAWSEKIQQFWTDIMDKLAGALGRGRA